MRRSKLELYEEILGALLKRPMGIDSLAFETSMDLTILRQHLDFLIKSYLVEERVHTKKTFYANTERGVAVLKILNFQKYIERTASLVRVIEEALKIVPALSKDGDKKKPDEENENY
jgi:predicted transcriptional regulator